MFGKMTEYYRLEEIVKRRLIKNNADFKIYSSFPARGFMALYVYHLGMQSLSLGLCELPPSESPSSVSKSASLCPFSTLQTLNGAEYAAPTDEINEAFSLPKSQILGKTTKLPKEKLNFKNVQLVITRKAMSLRCERFLSSRLRTGINFSLGNEGSTSHKWDITNIHGIREFIRDIT